LFEPEALHRSTSNQPPEVAVQWLS
jgi:hypothetical protein